MLTTKQIAIIKKGLGFYIQNAVYTQSQNKLTEIIKDVDEIYKELDILEQDFLKHT